MAYRLTDREVKILNLLAADKTNREIAAELGISHKTVETHRSNIMRKLDAHSFLELLRAGVAIGALSRDELLGSAR